MSQFAVLLEGVNFQLELDGRNLRVGFHVARFVDSTSPADACRAAVELVTRELQERKPKAMGTVKVGSVASMPWWHRFKALRCSGFAFYPMESEPGEPSK